MRHGVDFFKFKITVKQQKIDLKVKKYGLRALHNISEIIPQIHVNRRDVRLYMHLFLQLHMSVQEPLLSRDLHVASTLLMVCAVWAIATALMLPNYFSWGGHTFDEKVVACVFDRSANYSYTVFLVSLSSAPPIACIVVCYVADLPSRDGVPAFIARLRRAHSHGAAGVESEAGDSSRQVAVRHIRRVCRLLVAARRHLPRRRQRPLSEDGLRRRHATGAREQCRQQRRVRRHEQRVPRRLPTFPVLLLLDTRPPVPPQVGQLDQSFTATVVSSSSGSSSKAPFDEDDDKVSPREQSPVELVPHRRGESASQPQICLAVFSKNTSI